MGGANLIGCGHGSVGVSGMGRSVLDEEVDFVVVGSGGGSLVAALVLREAGLSVLVLEKTDKVGGSTARSGGVMWIPDNPFMKRDGIADSKEAAARYLEAIGRGRPAAPGATAARRAAYVGRAAEVVDYLGTQGIRLTRVGGWPDYYDEKPGASVDGRTVVAELFDARQLGEWYPRLRQGYLSLPVSTQEMLQLPHLRNSWNAKLIAFKAAWRGLIAKLTGRQWVSGGMALQGRLLQAALCAGVRIEVETPVTELVVEGGAVRGVLASRDGRKVRIGAKFGVLVNAGGFARNQEMRDRYLPGTSADWTLAGPGDTGEMIQEMARHGAALAQMDEMVGHQITIPPGMEGADFKPSVQRLAAGPHAIVVDRSGRRYLNEAGSYMQFCQAMLDRNRTVPAVPSWIVFDARCMRRYMVAGTMPGTPKPKAWYDRRYLRTGANLAELARAMELDPVVLGDTVRRFNGFAEQGRDEDFGRGQRAYDRWLGDPYHPGGPSLGAIATGPFYALPVLPGDVGTYGGVVCDEDSRVLREDGTAISGLYATGVSTASVMGRAYPGAGGSVGPAVVWGYIAARHALSRTTGSLQGAAV